MRYNQQVTYIHRYLSGELNEIEEKIFLNWLNSEEGNKLLFSEISMIWEGASKIPVRSFDAKKAFMKHKMMLEQTSSIAQEQKIKHLPASASTPKILSIKFLSAIAASFLLIISAWYILTNNSTTYNSKESLVASLDDGTKVKMDDNTILQYKQKSGKRIVELNGKAFFNVTKNAGKAFIVKTDSLEVIVIGTSFTVDSKNNRVFVKEGKVEVVYNDVSRKLHADQMVGLLQNGLSKVNDTNFYDSGLWSNEELSFNKTPFDIVIKDISDFFGVSFEIPQGRDWKSCPFTSGSLKKNSLDQIITTLKLTYDLDCVKTDHKNYKISKVRCR